MILQIFSCAAISNKIERRMTKPKLAISSRVNTVVCVINPGPIAEVAIKKAAPKTADVFVLFIKGGRYRNNDRYHFVFQKSFGWHRLMMRCIDMFDLE